MRSRAATIAAVLFAFVAGFNVMSVTSDPVEQQPIPDAREYVNSAQHIANGEGFVQNWQGARSQPPRYSPGYPMTLAPFAKLVDYPEGVQLGSRLTVLAYVLAIIGVAWALGGPLAAIFAASIVMLSPFARQAAAISMSDAFGAALLVLPMALFRFQTKAGDRLAGAIIGYAIAVRVLGGAALVGALVVAGGNGARRRIVLSMLPFVVGVALLQWAQFGSPMTTGYDNWNAGFKEMFAIGNPFSGAAPEGFWMLTEPYGGHLIDALAPAGAEPGTGLQNLFFYPAVLLGIVWLFTPPLVPLVGLLWGWRHREDPAVRYALVTIAVTLVLYLFYQYQAARLMAGPAALLIVLTACGLASAVEWMRRFEVVWREREASLAGEGAGASAAESVAPKAPAGGW